MLFGDMFKNGPLGDPNQRQMIGLQMLANSGPSVGAPGNLFAGLPQAVMSGKQLSEKQREKLQEEERNRMRAKALAGIQGMDPELLAGGDYDFALKKYELMNPVQKPVTASSTVGKIMSDFNAGLYGDGQKATEIRDAAIQKALEGSGMEMFSDGKGGFTFRQGSGVGKGNGNMTESQAKANIFATRGEEANRLLSGLEGQGTSLGQALISGAPLGNYALTPEYRQYDQAKRDFVNAILRQESGAVIADTEFQNAGKQYFPQPGDDPATIEQKRRNRETAIKAIREASGRGPATSGTIDLSTMSDGELEAIANGQ
jgi:hypothetical protein